MQRSVLELGKSIKFFKVGGKVRGIFRVGQNVSAFECEASVAYTYYKIMRERQREFQKRTSNSLPNKKEAAPVPPLRSTAKGETSAAKAPQTRLDIEDHEEHHSHPKFHVPNLKRLRGNCKEYCAIILYVLLGVITMLVAAAVIIITSLAAVSSKAYDAEQSSRLVAMVVLAVTAAAALSMVIYAVIGAFRKHVKSIHATGVVMVILVIIQALIIALAIKISAKDELAIGKSLGESFRLAREDNTRHVKLWSSTQADLQCCGVYSPEDYRDPTMPYYFPPNVPIACCPTFDPKKAPYNQERQRELCKVNGTYYDTGCKDLIIEVFKETSVVVIGVIIVLIVLEVLLIIVGAYLNRKHKKIYPKDDHEFEADKQEKPQQTTKK